jgi:PAS domain S-box-containing protein
MNLWSLIPLVAFLVNSFTWVYLFARRRTAQANRAYLIFAAAISLWALLDFFSWQPVSEQALQLLQRVQLLFWVPIGFFFLNFIYALLRRARDAPYYVALSVAVLATALALSTDLVMNGVLRQPWGGRGLSGPLFVPVVLATQAGPGLYALGLMLQRYRWTPDADHRRQLRLLLVGLLVMLLAGLGSDVLLPELFGLVSFPALASSISAVFSLAAWLAVARASFLDVTVEEAALQIFETARDGILLLDRHQRVTLMNRAARELLPLDSAETTYHQVSTLLDDQELRGRQEELVVVVGGEERVLSVSQSPIERQSSELGRLVILQDVTERNRMEAQLRQAQKMDAIGTLAGGVAHDMNNVLGAVMAVASVIKLESPPDGKHQDDIDEVLASCRRGRDLTQNLLGFARKGKYIKKRLSLNDRVESVTELLGRTISKLVVIDAELEPGLLAVEGDPGQITHVLMNVCLNAVDAMSSSGSGKGELSIRTANVELDQVDLKGDAELRPGTYVRVEIRDSGEGMESETLSRAFEPFFSTKPKGKGTGLGLSMVYGTVANHGGRVSIESEPGQGTTVTIDLPALSSGEVELISGELVPLSTSLERCTVLLVDDEEMVRAAGQRMLESLGHQVLLAEDGARAVEIYREQRERVGLVLLDLVMPVMDGAEAFNRLQELDPGVRVLITSGHAMEEAAEALLSRGALGFLQKPYAIDLLALELAQAMERPEPPDRSAAMR